jgi:hypothetical protein
MDVVIQKSAKASCADDDDVDRQMQHALELIQDASQGLEDAGAFHEACRRVPQLVADESNPRWFLRCVYCRTRDHQPPQHAACMRYEWPSICGLHQITSLTMCNSLFCLIHDILCLPGLKSQMCWRPHAAW